MERLRKSILGHAQDFHDGLLLVEAFAIFIADNDQKQIQGHRLVAETMQMSAVQELVIDYGIASGPSHDGGNYPTPGGIQPICVCISRGVHGAAVHPDVATGLLYQAELRLYLTQRREQP